MKSIADALVYSVAYLGCREDEDSTDDDETALSHIMAYLSQATPEEENALADAAERALEEERSLHHPQEEMIDIFSRWMEIMFGRDWDGNSRVDDP